MHPFDVIIVISIACCVGFVPAIYVKSDAVLAIGYFVGSTAGAFAGSHMALWWLPGSGKPGILTGGFLGAILLVGLWHLARRHHDNPSCEDGSRPPSQHR